MYVLGIRIGHDSAAALVQDGTIVADVAEERFTRLKNDGSFPINAIEYCLGAAGITSEQLDCVAFPSTKFPVLAEVFFDLPQKEVERIKEKSTSWRTRVRRLLGHGKQKRTILPLYQKPLRLSPKCRIHLCQHHLAHAASAFFTSGLNKEPTLIVTMDGIGDGTSVALWRGEGKRIIPLASYGGTGSLGWFYGNATEGLGWRHGSDEWKTMGLSPFGTPQPGLFKGFYPEYRDGELVQEHAFGEFSRWNDHGANHYHGVDSMELSRKVISVGREDYAAEAQRVVEEQAMNIVVPWLKREQTRHLCCAGGFFLNVKLNQRLWYSGLLDTQWIYPNPGDAGLPVGAALHAFYEENPTKEHSRLADLYLGPAFTNDEIEQILDDRGLAYRRVPDPVIETAAYLEKNLVIGWFQGRMESGPRALGNRSILMSPMRAENKDIVNAKIKYRESFRPFCPSMLYEKSYEYLINPRDEFFMVSSFDVNPEIAHMMPAVVHVDGTARPQMVHKDVNPLYHRLIEQFGQLTGVYAVMNTSFNIKGEPIVCTPREAIRCFFDTGMDVLVLGNCILEKPKLGTHQ